MSKQFVYKQLSFILSVDTDTNTHEKHLKYVQSTYIQTQAACTGEGESIAYIARTRFHPVKGRMTVKNSG